HPTLENLTPYHHPHWDDTVDNSPPFDGGKCNLLTVASNLASAFAAIGNPNKPTTLRRTASVEQINDAKRKLHPLPPLLNPPTCPLPPIPLSPDEARQIPSSGPKRQISVNFSNRPSYPIPQINTFILPTPPTKAPTHLLRYLLEPCHPPDTTLTFDINPDDLFPTTRKVQLRCWSAATSPLVSSDASPPHIWPLHLRSLTLNSQHIPLPSVAQQPTPTTPVAEFVGMDVPAELPVHLGPNVIGFVWSRAAAGVVGKGVREEYMVGVELVGVCGDENEACVED
ncbi:hypothetical protein HK104_006497, partial [Borealophlyctis nickersoniae]